MFDGAGIGFETDFRARGKRQAIADAGQDSCDLVRGEKARRASPEEDRFNGSACQSIREVSQVAVKIREQGIHVCREGRLRGGCVAVEIAVGTFAHAPWKVHVEPQRDPLVHGALF